MGKPQRVQDTWDLTHGPKCIEVGGRGQGWLYLYPSFWEVDPGCQLVADVDIRVVGKVEDLLQLMQLLGGEGGSDPPLALPLLWMEAGPSWVSDLGLSEAFVLSCSTCSTPVATTWPLAP